MAETAADHDSGHFVIPILVVVAFANIGFTVMLFVKLIRAQTLFAQHACALNTLAREMRSRFGLYALDPSYTSQQIRRFGDRCVVPVGHPALAHLPPPDPSSTPPAITCDPIVPGAESWLWYSTAAVDAAMEKIQADADCVPPLDRNEYADDTPLFIPAMQLDDPRPPRPWV